MGILKPLLLTMLTMLTLNALPARAEDGLSRQLPCGSWARDIQPTEWGHVMHDCAAQGRYQAALRAFYAYNSYILFDQQRVRDDSAHAIKDELNLWILTGLSRDQFQALRPLFDQMRSRQGPTYRATCAALQQLGPPKYHPDYMIRRGMMPRKSDQDWLRRGFDPAVAWRRALVELNGCP